MKFAVLQFFSWPERRIPLAQVYERALDRIRIMDTAGYDAVWLAEHHFSTYSVCPSIHIMGMHVANMTRNVRIGTGVSLAAFYHPLRLAEEVALLDNLSGGRVNWGAGRGFDKAAGRAGIASVPQGQLRYASGSPVLRLGKRPLGLGESGRALVVVIEERHRLTTTVHYVSLNEMFAGKKIRIRITYYGTVDSRVIVSVKPG